MFERAVDCAISMTAKIIISASAYNFSIESKKEKFDCIIDCLKGVLLYMSAIPSGSFTAWQKHYITKTLNEWHTKH